MILDILFKDVEPEINRQGNKLYRTFYSCERYKFDFNEDMKNDGWEQYDTDQDAWYFGAWINKKKFMILTYAEGDVNLVKCENKEQFNTEIKAMNEFYGEGFVAKAYGEDGCTVYRQDRNNFFIQ